jgi:UDP-glucose 4-epimerase
MAEFMPEIDWSAARVLVTGGAGFIGSHLVGELVRLGAAVTVVDNLRTGRLANLSAAAGAAPAQPAAPTSGRDSVSLPAGKRVPTPASGIHFIEADLIQALESPSLDLAGFDFVFHLAANPYIPPSVTDPRMDFQANLESTLALLEKLRALQGNLLGARAPQLINTSSAAVYGNPARLPICEGDPTVPIAPYGVSKLAAERYVAVYSQLYGLPATSLRLFSVFGPRQHKQVVYDFLGKLARDPGRLEILGDGTQARDFVYVGDVVQAMLLVAAAAPGAGETYNVATGQTHTIRELAEEVCTLCGLAPQITCTGQVRPGDAEKWYVDISALQALGYRPRTTLGQGLAAIRDWFNAGAP